MAYLVHRDACDGGKNARMVIAGFECQLTDLVIRDSVEYFRYVPLKTRYEKEMKYMHICAYCGLGFDKLTDDHMMPASWGYDKWKNVSRVCFRCNQKKGANSLGLWMIYMMRNEPRAPQIAIIRKMMAEHGHTFRDEVRADWADACRLLEPPKPKPRTTFEISFGVFIL